MTRISATKRDKAGSEEALDILGALTRRASHEVKNALNAVAVNVEVVRSRLARPDAVLADIQIFAERAAQASDAAASLGTGLADLSRLLVRALGAEGRPIVRTVGPSRIVTLRFDSPDDTEVSRDLEALAARIGVTLRVDGSTVIFTVRD